MGEDPADVYMTGCPSIDLIPMVDLARPDDLFERYGGVGAEVHPNKPYIVVLQHPVTTEYGQGFAQVEQTLQAIDRIAMPTVWLWPNVDAGSDDISKGLRVYREQRSPDFVHFYRNFSAEDYLRLINGASCLVGNSSSGIREGAFLGVPVVNIGTRQQARERGPNVLDVGYDNQEIETAIRRQLAKGQYERSELFGDGKAGERIVEVLAKHEFKIQKRLTYSFVGSDARRALA